MMKKRYAFSIETPRKWTNIKIVEWGKQKITLSGRLTEVRSPERIKGWDHYDCFNDAGDHLLIVRLEADNLPDWEAQESFDLLDGKPKY